MLCVVAVCRSGPACGILYICMVRSSLLLPSLFLSLYSVFSLPAGLVSGLSFDEGAGSGGES